MGVTGALKLSRVASVATYGFLLCITGVSVPRRALPFLILLAALKGKKSAHSTEI